MEVDEGTQTAFRETLERLLASPEFSSSRQLQDFLRYTSELAFKGTIQVEQVEIAGAVLGRSASFNPVEDASVRKLASLARQRLGQYYARTGNRDEIVVTLPIRTYVPRYERRPRSLDAPPKLLPPSSQGRFPGKSLWLFAALAGLIAAVVIAFQWKQESPDKSDPVFTIVTQKGDISSRGSDISPTGVQLGPLLRDFDEVSAVMRFTAARENQQAGILIWQDDDHYIQLGRRFLGRNQIAFVSEDGGNREEHSVRYDPDGQSGNPIWLILRKEANLYKGLISFDGLHWGEMGVPLVGKRALVKPRLGIYAFNGRRDVPAAKAYFSKLSTGYTFAGWSGDPSTQLHTAGWDAPLPCSGSLIDEFESSALQFAFQPSSQSCNIEWSVPAPKGDWEYVTKLDFFTLPGVSAGLNLRGGTADAVRVVRYELNGPSLCFIYDGRLLKGTPDVNGSPAVYLRLRNRRGIITGAFSKDGSTFHPLPGSVSLSDLGTHVKVGLRVTSKGHARSRRPAASPFRIPAPGGDRSDSLSMR